MTDREREMADIKEAEGVEVQGTSARRNHASVGMEVNSDVTAAWQALVKGERKIVELVSCAQMSTQRIELILRSEGSPLINRKSKSSWQTERVMRPYLCRAIRLHIPSTRIRLVSVRLYTARESHTCSSQLLAVFIYCCPDTSPVRGRMIYSSNAQPLVADAKQAGVDVVKKASRIACYVRASC
jgi:twinfilin-like protein